MFEGGSWKLDSCKCDANTLVQQVVPIGSDTRLSVTDTQRIISLAIINGTYCDLANPTFKPL
jgi:hypothetical protein